MLGVLVVSECLFEWRAGQAVTNAAREIAQIQPLACRIDWPEQALQSPLQILRANQERLGVLFARLNQANGWLRRESREEVFLRPRTVKFESAVEFQHAVRIL